MAASPKAERIHALDGLRGVACVAVLLLHAATMLELWGESGPYPLIPGTPAVVVFFVLSGVVLSIAPLARLREGRPYDWLGYYPRRVVRLGLPLVAAIALGVVAGLVAWTLGSAGRSATAIDFDGTASQVIHDVLMQFDVLFFVSDDTVTLFGDPLVRVNSPVWSMGWELWFSLTLPLAVALLARVRRDVPASLLIFAGIFLSYWSGYFPLRLCLTFWLGVLLAKHLGELSRVRLTAPIELLALVLLLGVVELVQAASAGMLGSAGPLLAAALPTLMVAACMGIVALAMTNGLVRRALSARPVRFLGAVSFSLYLTHAVTIGALEALPRLGVVEPLVQAALAAALSLAVAVVFWHVVEKPGIALSRRVGDAFGTRASQPSEE